MHEQHEFCPETIIQDCESQVLPTGQTVNEISPSTVQVAVGTWQRRSQVENKSAALVVLPPVMTRAEAHQCLNQIKEHWASIRALVLELKERRGWEALGYPHFTACLKAEFSESRTKLIRELKAAEVEKHILQVPIGTWPASHFRPLSKLKPTQYKPALDKAHELAGDDKLTALCIAEAVRQIIAPTRLLKTAKMSSYQFEELVRIQCRTEALPTQKKWNGCWGIVQSIGTHVQVLIGDQKVEYEAADLKRDENSEVQFRQTCERILALWQTELEAIEQTLQELLHRQFFTDLETQIVYWLETKRSGMMF